MANEEWGYEDSIEARNRQLQVMLAACVLRDRRAFAQLYELTSAKLYLKIAVTLWYRGIFI
ncbi:MAG: hypothetical protein PVG22_12835 [Chromatiales bacterium]|jgi:hypothetical protein